MFSHICQKLCLLLGQNLLGPVKRWRVKVNVVLVRDELVLECPKHLVCDLIGT